MSDERDEQEKLSRELKAIAGGCDVAPARKYIHKTNCFNCHQQQTLNIPKGMMISDFINQHVCSNCGCCQGQLNGQSFGGGGGWLVPK